MLSAFGQNRLMPSPELECVVVNTKSGYARTNKSWLLSRLLRDTGHWMPALTPADLRRAELNKLEELRDLNEKKTGKQRKERADVRISLRATVWRYGGPEGRSARGQHDVVYWSGVLVLLVQILAFGIPPLILYGEYFTIMVTGLGTVLAWLSGALPQWVEEKTGVRNLGKAKDILLTEGSGAYDLLLIKAQEGALDLEALAGSQRHLRHPRTTRMLSIALAVCWIAFLITVSGWEQHTWYVLGVGIIGMVHNVFVAGWERSPSALGIPLQFEEIFLDDKVMKVLWHLEQAYPGAGSSAVPSFFPGGLIEKEKKAWAFADERVDDWEARGRPVTDGKPDAWAMPDARWVDEKHVNLNIFSQPV